MKAKDRLPVKVDDLGLTPREIRFVCEYVTNGYKADIAAKDSGFLPKDAGTVAIRLHCAKLLGDARIKEAIQRTKDSFVEPYRDVHYTKIQEQLEVRAFYDIHDYYNADGTPIPIDQIPEKKRYAIDGIDKFNAVDKNGVEHEVFKGYILANKDKARSELRALHEVKEEKKDLNADAVRNKILDMITAFARGTEAKALEESKKDQEVPAILLAKKIKEGEYAVKEK